MQNIAAAQCGADNLLSQSRARGDMGVCARLCKAIICLDSPLGLRLFFSLDLSYLGNAKCMVQERMGVPGFQRAEMALFTMGNCSVQCKCCIDHGDTNLCHLPPVMSLL